MPKILPLIEAFAAYALTMVALTTAVASLVSVVQRMGRWRALGLRQQASYLFNHDVVPVMAGLTRAPAATTATLATPPDRDPKANAIILLGGSPTSLRDRFLVDMTMLPGDYAALAARSVGILDWLREWRDRMRGVVTTRKTDDWRSLAYTVDALTDDEFIARLRNSEIGKAIAALAADDKERIFASLKDRFNAIGRAATEGFARRSRKWTVAFGFSLAILANIDSFSLINRYLIDPALVKLVLDKEEAIRKANAGDFVPAPAPVPAGKLENQLQNAQTALSKLQADLAAVAPENPRVAELAKATEATVAAFNTEVTRAQDVVNEARSFIATTRQSVFDLSETFPVGWSLYPNCEGKSVAPRCTEYLARKLDLKAGAVAATSTQQGVVMWVWSWPRSAVAPLIGWISPETLRVLRNVADVASVDSANFLKWLAGVLITGAFLGLGAPFWVEVVNNFLRARNLITDYRGGDNTAKGGVRRPV